MRSLIMIGCMIDVIKKEGNQAIDHQKQVLSRGQMHTLRGRFERSKERSDKLYLELSKRCN